MREQRAVDEEALREEQERRARKQAVKAALETIPSLTQAVDEIERHYRALKKGSR